MIYRCETPFWTDKPQTWPGDVAIFNIETSGSTNREGAGDE